MIDKSSGMQKSNWLKDVLMWCGESSLLLSSSSAISLPLGDKVGSWPESSDDHLTLVSDLPMYCTSFYVSSNNIAMLEETSWHFTVAILGTTSTYKSC